MFPVYPHALEAKPLKMKPASFLPLAILIAVVVHRLASVTILFPGHHSLLKQEGDLKSCAGLAIYASVRYWNAQPDSSKYHVADRYAPLSGSCGGYAEWLNRTAGDVCDEIREAAGTYADCCRQLA